MTSFFVVNTGSAVTPSPGREPALRIAVIAACPFPWPRGTPVRIHRLAEALALRGHDVHVLTYHLGMQDVPVQFAVHRIPGVAGYTRTSAGPSAGKLLRLNPQLVRLLRERHAVTPFDVIHAHHYEGILVASGAGTGVPIVYDAHTTLGGELPQYRLPAPRAVVRAIGNRLDRVLPRRATRIMSVSEAIRDRLVAIGAVRPDRIEVVANGVEFAAFQTTYPEPRSNANLIYTGNLSAYQGIDLLLEAFAILHRRRPAVRLTIATDSPFDPYEASAQRLGVREAIDVRPAPFSAVPGLLASSEIAINPRVECDGIPQKLLNYMAAARPIVSFDGSAVHLVHEQTGLRVADRDTHAMAQAIERLLDDRALALRLGVAARTQVERERSWDNVAERGEAVFRRAIADGGR